MGLLNARNLRKAKDLLEKNRHKVGDVVEKAGTQLDKVSNGKTANVTSKASDAAKKYSAGSNATHHGIDTPNTMPSGQHDLANEAEAKRRQAEAAGAVTGAANAFTNFMNKAAEKLEASGSNDPANVASKGEPAPADEVPVDQFDKG
ncbi:MAG: antitoxin [Ilumatobacter sp.]